MNHEMNTLAIGRQEAFSTMVSNKVPATAHCLSDGIHKAKESCGEQRGWGDITKRQRIVGKRGIVTGTNQVENIRTGWRFGEEE